MSDIFEVTHLDHSGGTKFYRVMHNDQIGVVIFQWGKKYGSNNMGWADGQFKVDTPHKASQIAREKIWEKEDRGYERTATFDIEVPSHYLDPHTKEVKSKRNLASSLDREARTAIQQQNGQQTLNPNQRKAPDPQDPAAWNGQNTKRESNPADLDALLDRLNAALVKAASGEEAWVEYATLSTAVQEARQSLERAEATFEALESLVLDAKAEAS